MLGTVARASIILSIGAAVTTDLVFVSKPARSPFRSRNGGQYS